MGMFVILVLIADGENPDEYFREVETTTFMI